MKTSLLWLACGALAASCTNMTSGTQKSTTGSPVALPYAAGYSSRFSIGSDSNTLAVLNNYKAWETGDRSLFENTLGDTVSVNFTNGGTFRGSRDSATYYAFRFRDSLTSVVLRMDAFVPLHADDRNEDWVTVWYTETDTYKNGRVDSTNYVDDNLLDASRRIVFIDSHKRTLR